MLDFISPLVGWFGLGGAAIIGLGALAYFFPPLRKVAMAIMAGIGTALFLYRKGYKDAHERAQREREAAERRAVQTARDARAAGERDAAAGVRDNYDRDKP